MLLFSIFHVISEMHCPPIISNTKRFGEISCEEISLHNYLAPTSHHRFGLCKSDEASHVSREFSHPVKHGTVLAMF